MYSIGIIGDVHIDTHVSSRKDDYFYTCLQKIEEVAIECKNIIFLGDVFNRETIPNDYFYKFYMHISYLKTTYNCVFYSIVGNHDIPNEDEDNLSKTSLGLCNLTEIIKLISVDKPLEFGKYTFYTSYVNLQKCKEHLKTLHLKENDILLLHQYYEDGFPGLEYEDVKNIGCKKIFLGHEHTPFKDFVKNYSNLSIYRCGSLLRNSANEANLNRDIFYFKLNHLDEVTVHKLNCMKPAIEVFTESAYNQENLHKKRFIKNINEVIDKYTNNISTQVKFSIQETLKELHTPDYCMTYINEVYNKIGETLL